jgi:hypothetical protein
MAALVMVFMGVLLFGLVVEVGHLYLVRRQLQHDADSAAVWGAMQLDFQGLRDSDGSKVHIMPTGDTPAQATWSGAGVLAYLAELGYRAEEISWQWGRCTFQVELRRPVKPVFVSLAGFEMVTLRVTARARLNNSDDRITCG